MVLMVFHCDFSTVVGVGRIDLYQLLLLRHIGDGRPSQA